MAENLREAVRLVKYVRLEDLYQNNEVLKRTSEDRSA